MYAFVEIIEEPFEELSGYWSCYVVLSENNVPFNQLFKFETQPTLQDVQDKAQIWVDVMNATELPPDPPENPEPEQGE